MTQNSRLNEMVLQELRENISNIIQKNIGNIEGKYVLVYDRESTLAKIITDWYSAVLPSDHTSIHFAETDINFKSTLITLPRWSLVILVQSTNFRITDFRIRLELFQYGIHCIEHNHLGYYPDEQVTTYIRALQYRTPAYIEATKLLNIVANGSMENSIVTKTGERLTFGALETIRGNTGDYSNAPVKWGTYPIGEAFTEAVDLSEVSGEIKVFAYPNDLFQVVFCEPFVVTIQNGLLLDNPNHPVPFRTLMDRIRNEENGEALVREYGIGYNPAIDMNHRLSDVNGHERHLGVHLSIGKKHGIYTKKFPKWILQKYHIDIFLEVDYLEFGRKKVLFDSEKILVLANE